MIGSSESMREAHTRAGAGASSLFRANVSTLYVVAIDVNNWPAAPSAGHGVIPTAQAP